MNLPKKELAFSFESNDGSCNMDAFFDDEGQLQLYLTNSSIEHCPSFEQIVFSGDQVKWLLERLEQLNQELVHENI